MIFCALSFVFVTLFFFYHNYLFLVLHLFSTFFLYKRNTKTIFLLSQILIFIFCLFRFSYFNVTKINNGDNYQVIEKYDNYVILEKDRQKYVYYDNDLERGNNLIIKGEASYLEKGSFNDYLHSQNIHYLLEGRVIYNDEYLCFSEQIINYLLREKDEENKEYLKLILFNRGKKDSYFYSLFETFSISFLVVISGFHINLIFKVLKKRKFLKYILSIFYLYLLNFSVSSLKAFLYYVVKKIVNKGELILNNCDILSLILISLLFINPGYCFNRGFIYSFSFSYIIDIINNTVIKKGFKYSYMKKTFIFLFSIPIILINNYSINSNAYLASIILVYPVSFLFIFSLLYLLFDKFYLVYKLYIYLLTLLLEFLSDFSIELVFGKPSYIVIILLYFMLAFILFFYQNKLYKQAYFSLTIYLLICLFQYCLPYIDHREPVYFINVGQGDCISLKIKNSKSVVLIDTGGNKYRDLATSNIIPFLKSKGIDTIEKIIITHDDFDHNGSKDSLINNFHVKDVIEDSLINEVLIGEHTFLNLNINDKRDNDGSIVLYGSYGGINYLFSGDISSSKEREIINKYDLDVDVLKVSHHGASSSSDEMFIKKITPLIALIGVSKNNSYNHPSTKVLDILHKYNAKIYRTDIDNNIIIYKSLISEEIIIERE